MGKSQAAVCPALEELRQALPFTLRGVDSDNVSEFINVYLYRYCDARNIQFTRGRPYKKVKPWYDGGEVRERGVA